MPELLSPQDAYALFRSSGAFLVDVRRTLTGEWQGKPLAGEAVKQ